MKLDISTSTALILALPAHRSANEHHRKLGERAFSLLDDYKTHGVADTEKAFNSAMTAAILSTVRAFSVERDRIGGQWKAIEAIRRRREEMLSVFRSMSPFSKGNYWAKAVSIIAAAGFSFGKLINGVDKESWSAALWLLGVLLGMEILSKIGEFAFANWFEKALPIEKEKKWRRESMKSYKNILEKFIANAIAIHLNHYPDEKAIDGFDVANTEGISRLTENVIARNLFLME